MSDIGDRNDATPILEIGGTHATAAWVHPNGWLVSGLVRRGLDADGSAAGVIGDLARTAAELDAPVGAHWGLAVPGPFDYELGIARYAGVGKFDSLSGVDVRAALTEALPRRPGSISFVNDASAFLIGEWLTGAARGVDRCAAITLGTGIGSAFLDHGVVIDRGPQVPPQAEVHLLVHDGRPLEDWVSRRAIRRRYACAVGGSRAGGHADPSVGPDAPGAAEPSGGLDVDEIARLARSGHAIAAGVLDEAFELLGRLIRPWLRSFGAEVLVVGGSVSRSWDLVEPPLLAGLSSTSGQSVPTVRLARHPERSPLVGAAYPAITRSREGSAD